MRPVFGTGEGIIESHEAVAFAFHFPGFLSAVGEPGSRGVALQELGEVVGEIVPSGRAIHVREDAVEPETFPSEDAVHCVVDVDADGLFLESVGEVKDEFVKIVLRVAELG
jgi:hypothetical protein